MSHPRPSFACLICSAPQISLTSKLCLFSSLASPLTPSNSRLYVCLVLGMDSLWPWFHGGASRQAAEKMLSEEGKYLVRFSERFPVRVDTLCILIAIYWMSSTLSLLLCPSYFRPR